MADTINDGGMAFPRGATEFGGSVWQPQDGMSLRDYFAGQAVIALGAHKAVTARGIPWLAEHAWMIAEAMMAERVQRYGPAPTQAELDAADDALQF
jgi:hypothetical protein